MRLIFSLLSILFVSAWSGTEYIRSIHVAAITGQPLHYASVSVLNRDFYAVANQNGQVFLPERIKDDDSLFISCPGYYDKKMAVSELNGATAFMDPVPYPAESDMRKGKKKSFLINPKGSWKESSTKVLMLTPGSQVLNRFEKGNNEFILQKLKFRTIPPVYQNLELRLRVYEIDEKTGMPGADMLGRHVTIKLNTADREHVIDLKEQGLLIRKTKFYAGVELLVDATGVQDSSSLNLKLGIETMPHIPDHHSLQHFPGKSPWFIMPDLGKLKVEGFTLK